MFGTSVRLTPAAASRLYFQPMDYPPNNADMELVVDLMRNLSLQTDPHQAAELYSRGLDRLNLVPCERYLSLSRRDLEAPQFRITRNSDWKEHPNPWKERHKLPVISGGCWRRLFIRMSR